jgi:hypothetical protein
VNNLIFEHTMLLKILHCIYKYLVLYRNHYLSSCLNFDNLEHHIFRSTNQVRIRKSYNQYNYRFHCKKKVVHKMALCS